jgi:hypothetical protein
MCCWFHANIRRVVSKNWYCALYLAAEDRRIVPTPGVGIVWLGRDQVAADPDTLQKSPDPNAVAAVGDAATFPIVLVLSETDLDLRPVMTDRA